MPHRLILVIILFVGVIAGITHAAEQSKLTFDVYSGYFVSNKFEPDAPESFVVIDNQEQFDTIFGVAMVMGDKSHRLPKDAFKSNVVLTAIKRGKAVWEFDVQGVTETNGVVELRYKATSKSSDSATFACPLIVSIPKGKYKAVRFVENGKLVKAVNKKKTVSMSSEITNLATSLETYKTELGGGDYPPSDPAEQERHLRRAFPRYIGERKATFSGPDEALHFWLAGPDGEGWSADPMRPFANAATVPQRYGPFFEFDKDRLTGHVYKPFERSTDPLLYFRSTSFGTTCTVPSGTVVTAIKVDSEGKYAKPRSFQIHCPGVDGKFGSGGYLNDPTGYTKERLDDMGNFVDFTLEDHNK